MGRKSTRGCMYTRGWFSFLYSRNEHNTVKELYSYWKKKKKTCQVKEKKEYTLYFLFIRNLGRRKTHLSWCTADQWLSGASSVDSTVAQRNFTDDGKVLFRITPWLDWWFPKWCIYQNKTLSKQYISLVQIGILAKKASLQTKDKKTLDKTKLKETVQKNQSFKATDFKERLRSCHRLQESTGREKWI